MTCFFGLDEPLEGSAEEPDVVLGRLCRICDEDDVELILVMSRQVATLEAKGSLKKLGPATCLISGWVLLKKGVGMDLSPRLLCRHRQRPPPTPGDFPSPTFF